MLGDDESRLVSSVGEFRPELVKSASQNLFSSPWRKNEKEGVGKILSSYQKPTIKQKAPLTLMQRLDMSILDSTQESVLVSDRRPEGQKVNLGQRVGSPMSSMIFTVETNQAVNMPNKAGQKAAQITALSNL